MAKICSVQVEILLTADEKALLDHYVKEQNQRYKKRGATRNWWTLEKLLQCLLSDITYQAVKYRSVRAVWQKLSCLVYKFTQRRRLDVWRLRHKEKILFVC